VPAMKSLHSKMDDAIGHWRRYDRASLAKTLTEAGFEAERLWPFNAFAVPGWWLNGRVLKRTTPPAEQVKLFNRNAKGLELTAEGSLLLARARDLRLSLRNVAREVTDVAQRRALYREAIDLIGARRNTIFLYHPNYIVAFPKNFKSYKAVPDGLIRIKGTSWQ